MPCGVGRKQQAASTCTVRYLVALGSEACSAEKTLCAVLCETASNAIASMGGSYSTPAAPVSAGAKKPCAEGMVCSDPEMDPNTGAEVVHEGGKVRCTQRTPTRMLLCGATHLTPLH